MENKNICIVTQSHLCRNPRVLKEAILLAENRYDVTIINSNYSSLLKLEDEELIKDYNIKLLPVVELQNKNLKSFIARLINALGRITVKKFGLQSATALGPFSWRYNKMALQQNAGLYICHQELGLYCGVQLLKSKKNVAFDFEDWYSEDLLDDAKKYRPIKLLKKLECYALQNGTFCLTTSKVMASHLAATYQSPEPCCIYNTFNSEVDNVLNQVSFTKPLKLFWFSQTIGPERGLEHFFSIINKHEHLLEIHLLGNVNDGYKSKLQALLSSHHHLYFHSLVGSAELPEVISKFDIGLALEMNTPINRSLTITNKLFQYFMSGLPVIATGTLGQKEIIDEHGGGIVINFNDAERALMSINKLLTDQTYLISLKQEAFEIAKKLNWDRQKNKLLNVVVNQLHE